MGYYPFSIHQFIHSSIHQYIYAYTLDISVERLRYSYLPWLLSSLIQHSQIFFISSNFMINKSFLNLYANKVASETLANNTQNSNPPKKNIPFCIWFVFTFAIFLFLVLEHLLALLLNPGGALAFAVRPLVALLLIFRTLAFSQRPCFPLCLCRSNEHNTQKQTSLFTFGQQLRCGQQGNRKKLRTGFVFLFE